MAMWVLGACSSPTSTTCYSYCSDMTTVASSCTAAGQAAQCNSAVVQPFSGSTTVNGLSLDDCTSYTNDAGVLVDGGCTPPTLTCVASGCQQSFNCMLVTNCAP
jgi:hypothetical protein